MTEKQTLRMILPLSHLSVFYPLLQRGVWLQAQIGCSVAKLLTEQFGIAENYVIERITTLFLDCKPVDDLHTSFVKDGSTVALSSAMPGLVGATMRRGGHLAAMRGEISLQGQHQGLSAPGRVRVKLFNMVMTELGAQILSHGIYLGNSELLSLLSDHEDSYWKSCGVIILNGLQIDPAQLKKQLGTAGSAAETLVKVEIKN